MRSVERSESGIACVEYTIGVIYFYTMYLVRVNFCALRFMEFHQQLLEVIPSSIDQQTPFIRCDRVQFFFYFYVRTICSQVEYVVEYFR